MRLRQLCRTTAVAACIAAMAAPPSVAAPPPSGKPVAPAGGPNIRVGQADGFTRLEFAGPGFVTSRRQGQDLIVTLRGDPDIARLKTAPTKLVKAVKATRFPGGVDVAITLAEGVDSKVGRSDGDTYVQIFPAAAPPPAPQAAAAAPAPPVDSRPAPGALKMQAEQAGGQLLLRFPWPAPVGAAVFRRGEALWVVFDTETPLDIAAAPRDGRFFDGLRPVQGAGFAAVRIALPKDAVVHAVGEGNTWTVALGAGPQAQPAPVKVQRESEGGPPTLQANMAGSTRVIWVADPIVGDRVAVVTALPPSKALPSRREYVDLALLQSMQGLAVEPIAEDLQVTADGDLVRVSRPGGLTLSSLADVAGGAGAGLPQPAIMPAVIDFRRWSKTGSGGFLTRYGALQDVAAEEVDRQARGDRSVGVQARMGLARFLAGSELSFETIGVLDMLARSRPEVLENAEFRGLRGAAKAMAGRYKEAEVDLSAPMLADDPSAALWRGFAAAKLGQWKDARAYFRQGLPALNTFSAPWQARFARADAQSALETGDLRIARTQIALALEQSETPEERLEAYLVKARLLEAQGMLNGALNVFDAVAKAPVESVAVPAKMRATRLRIQLAKIKPQEAADIFDGLRFRWRGDATELEVIRSLGGLYLSQGRYREALDAMRSAGQRLPNSPEAVELQIDLQGAFRALFLDGRADGLEPVQALALFYDFRELTPIGADGDLMVRKLARRLVDVDLLDRAAQLLQYQADNRLDGVARAQVATDLATIYLMDRKPEQALQAINNSRTTVLPTALNAERRLIEARAWLALNNVDYAVELIGKDASPEAQSLRAEIAWRQKDWAGAGAAYEKALGARWQGAGPLEPLQESNLLRAGVAYSLAGDEGALARLRAQYEGLVEQAQAPDALRVALTAFGGGEAVRPSAFTRLVAQDDAFAGWVAKMKQRFREKPAPVGAPGPAVAQASPPAAAG